MAQDLQLRGVAFGVGVTAAAVVEVEVPAKPGRGGGQGKRGGRRGGRSRSKSAFAARVAANAAAASSDSASSDEEPQIARTASALEKRCDPAELKIIRDLYGVRAQTIISALLAFDAYFNWYLPFKKSIPLDASTAVKEARALENMQTAVDMHEQFERLSIKGHGSFLPHGAIYKNTQDILLVGDVWAYDVSALELLNADTKRTAATGGARNLETRSAGESLKPMLGTKAGPAQLVQTKGYSTTMAISTLRKLLGKHHLRRGDGVFTTPDARRKERLFGSTGTGRLTLPSAKMKVEPGYHAHLDSVLKAFVRLLATQAET